MAEEKNNSNNNDGAAHYGAAYEGDEAHLRDYLYILRKHKWTIVITFLAIFAITSIKTLSLTPIYSSSTTIKIDRAAPKVLQYQDLLALDVNGLDFYGTQSRIIKSRTLGKRVVEALALWEHPEFQRKPKSGEAIAGAPESEAGMERLVDSFLRGLNVSKVKNSSLTMITFNSKYPELSARVANQVAQSYIDFNLESKYLATEKARKWLTGQLGEFQIKVEKSEEGLHKFTRSNGIFSLEKNENLVMKKLENLNIQLMSAEADRLTKESYYREIMQFSPSDLIPATSRSEETGGSLIFELRKRLMDMEIEYLNLSELYKPEYPKLINMKIEMDALHKMVEKEAENVVRRAEVSYRISLEKENLLKRAVDEQKELALNLKEKAIPYNILKREVDTNKELYDGLLQRVKETGVSAGLESSNVQVVDTAVVPRSPSRPDKKRNIMLGMVMGLFVGVGLAFFREYFDNTIKTPEEVTRLVDLPTLGLIPALQSTVSKRRGRKNENNGLGKEFQPGIEDLYTVSQSYPRSSISEACRTFRTSLLFSTPGHPPKTILVTSNNPREGKTFITCNLGIVMAQGGARTLIIDADLRRPACHKVFDIPNSTGLTDYLTGHVELKDVLVQTHVDGLSIMPAGPLSPNPPELLDSEQFRTAIEELKAQFDFIIFDSAPIMNFADTLNLANKVDGSIVVAYSGSTTKENLKSSVGLLRRVNAPILGVVMNIIDIRRNAYYYNYYYYGERTEKETETTPS